MRRTRIASVLAAALVGGTLAAAVGAAPAQAASGCTIHVSRPYHSGNHWAGSSTLSCTKVKDVKYVTKMYLWHAGAYRDGAYLGNSNMTKTWYASTFSSTRTQVVTGQEDKCPVMVKADVWYTVGSTRYSKGDVETRGC